MDQELQVDKSKVALIIIGMAGSGKTTFIQKLTQKLQFSDKEDAGMIVNLDPAVQFLPYTPNIDIRQTIDYKKLMKSHQLGPNGAIMTSLNLYCSQIDLVIKDIEAGKKLSDFIIIDTPGQIEVFTWSASGMIISQTISSTYPTVLLYIIDLAVCQDPNSFMSNMLFCCSIFYKMKLPMIVILNKEDTADKNIVIEWMKNYESVLEALKDEKKYLTTLNKQMVVSLDDFYKDLNVVAVSSLMGTGFENLFPMIDIAKQEYFEVTLPDLQKNLQKSLKLEKSRQEKEIQRFKQDQEQIQKEQKNKPQFQPMVTVMNDQKGQNPQKISNTLNSQFKMDLDNNSQQKSQNSNNETNKKQQQQIEIEEQKGQGTNNQQNSEGKQQQQQQNQELQEEIIFKSNDDQVIICEEKMKDISIEKK